jgi:hypothetical protein
MHRVRTRGPAKTLHACSDGSRRNEQDFAPLGMKSGNLARTGGNEVERQTGAVIGNERASYLDDESLAFS